MFDYCVKFLFVVYHQCQCSLFKQFTTEELLRVMGEKLFIINVNVLFLSNSQPLKNVGCPALGCLSSMSMFSF